MAQQSPGNAPPNDVPAARGMRLQWQDIPDSVVAAMESWLAEKVVRTETQIGGFSPAVAARVETTSGRRVFVKACPPGPNVDAPRLYRQEARVAAALPHTVPAPRLLWTYDGGDGGWVVLVFENIDGHMPAQPWQGEELNRVVDAVIQMSSALTPSPISAPSASDTFAADFCRWSRFVSAPSQDLDEWSARNLSDLIALDALAPEAVAGDTLLHTDIRADNVLLTDDRVYVVDWPHVCVGANWVEMICFAPSVAMQGGPPPEELLMRHPGARHADPAAITAAVAAITGYLTWSSLQPPPPGLPTVRAFQAAQAVVAREWLANRTAWR